MPWASSSWALALPLLALAGCATKSVEPIANIPSPIPENVPLVEAPPPPPVLINQSKGEDLWHLRSGLNVAVLLCQGPGNAAMVAAYNRALTQHKGLLASAAQMEVDHFKAKGGKKWQDAYDDHMTKIYNAYSGTLTRERYCPKSQTILDDINRIDGVAFNDQATVFLWELNKSAGIPDPDGKLARAAMVPPSPAAATASAVPLSALTPATAKPGTNRP
jgi:hypothetical protein